MSQNDIPRDKDGKPLKIGQMVVVEIIKEPPKAMVGDKEFFLGPAVRRLYDKLIFVGRKKSVTQPEIGGPSEEVLNDHITVIV